jgi:predicted Zn-dependent protease
MKAGRYDEAIEQYEQIQKKDANKLIAINNLAWLYHQKQDPRALSTAELAYRLNPDSSFISDTLGWILVERGEATRSLEILQKASAAAPVHPTIGYHYAVALAKSGEKAKARKQLEQLLGSGQTFPEEAQAKALLERL